MSRTVLFSLMIVLPACRVPAADTPTTLPPPTVQMTVIAGLSYQALTLLNCWEDQHPFHPGKDRTLEMSWRLTGSGGRKIENSISLLSKCGLIYLYPLITSGLAPGVWKCEVTVKDDRGVLLIGTAKGKMGTAELDLAPGSGNNVFTLGLEAVPSSTQKKPH